MIGEVDALDGGVGARGRGRVGTWGHGRVSAWVRTVSG